MSDTTHGVAFEIAEIRPPACGHRGCPLPQERRVGLVGPRLLHLRVCVGHVEWAKARLVKQDDES